MTLRLDEGGRWAIHSSSLSVMYLDLDRRLVLRLRGPGSPPWDYDGRWLPLVRVEAVSGAVDVITVGDRCLYLTDPDGGTFYQWWAPRTCTAIAPAHDVSLPPILG